ncbi:SH3 domain-containing protein [Streptomyces sp. LUP30]|uniref:SH3 domain-containing protein n=1 Tax=Streptomyces sp. LUP30 TaxID=1890285 RepID=UPI00085219BB|nr:SH3 domain-containing protein [Streptomyces sp. LUP30]
MSVDRVEEVESAETAVAVTAADLKTVALTYYPVAPGVRLNVRSGPGTGYPVVKVLAEGVKVPIFCQTPGTSVSGPYGTTSIWDNIGDGQFVSDAYVRTGSDGYVASRCG